jgi:hypothetical protein
MLSISRRRVPHFSRSARNGAFSLRKKKNFLDDLSNSGWPFDYIVKAGQAARPKTKELKTVNKEKS